MQYIQFQDELDDIAFRIEKYNTHINESGIWLFLATLGYWSVQGEWLPYITLCVITYFFLFRVVTGLSGFKSFKTELK